MSLLPSKLLCLLRPTNPILGLAHTRRQTSPTPPPLRRVLCAKRTGKQRYPSEKKKLRLKRKDVLADVKSANKFEGFWRLSKLGVPVHKDPGKDFLGISDGLLEAIAKVLEFPVASMLPAEAFSVVRKSFDARKVLKEPKFVYIVDMDVNKLISLEPRAWDFISRLEPKAGLIEHLPHGKVSGDLISIIKDCKKISGNAVYRDDEHDISSVSKGSVTYKTSTKPRIAIVGSGPSGLFASLVLAELGANVTLIERGKPVEQRGRDIGALIVRRILQTESNFCFGEGGAGTWSDGKLVTRIGRNSDSVLAVMKTLVHFGAPEGILVDGKPHLGTDRLVPLLRNFRQHLQELGVTIEFGKRVDDLLIEEGNVFGVRVSDSRDNSRSNSQKWEYDAVVLAVGHSARDIYEMLLSHNVTLVPKDFAVGLRIEHPQQVINSIQYSALASEVRCGRGKVPVADYKLVKYVRDEDSDASAGVEFQRELERKAAIMGGGNFVVPVQTVTDFLDSKLSATSVPPSSYRLGVKAAHLHELFPIHVTEALQRSISMFDEELPGFVSKEGLLHGVETRTSSPVQIPRSIDTFESTSLKGLYPIGEGAGYAGGIMSAAVDGMYAGFAVANAFELCHGGIESVFGKTQRAGVVKY
ncbi:uncharacterized protein LOC21397110 isoform X2 [Morus notabilis]|uniref:uncharacterized protein LOC21397110 isoform X2 n=1 Tax=Morus notabilis TaxID=981085 RepID=UPI000CECF423|nr:uncharacterized protein LOC21397110 isoform X2 [Morus notabilis]